MRASTVAVGGTILTNPVPMVVCLDRNSDLTLRQRQRNRYKINCTCRLRHPLESHRRIGGLLDHVGRP